MVMETSERSAETATENKPVYSVSVYAQGFMDGDTRTDENEDPISIFLPTLDHLVVFICSLGVYEKERPGAATEAGFSLQ